MTEDGFLRDLFQRLPAVGSEVVVPPGDDCAGLLLGSGEILLIAADQVIGDRHYVQSGVEATAPQLAGRKLLARNVSDIGAMGGTPTYCVICGAFGPGVDEAWMGRFHDGIIGLAKEWQIGILGGDLARSARDTVCSLTILGTVPAAEVVLRHGARAGDLLVGTGSFGGSFASGHHLTFPTRCREGRWLASQGYARAMIDVSDGVVQDAGRLCRQSGVGLCLDVSAVPLRAPCTDPYQAVMEGEDYELLLAVSPDALAGLQAAWPFAAVALTCLGRFREDPDAAVLDAASGRQLVGGYDHFAGATPAATPAERPMDHCQRTGHP